MKHTRILGGLLAASATLVAVVVLCLPASARQKDVPPPLTPEITPPNPPRWNGPVEIPRAPAEKKATNPKDATVDELIARLAELKAKEAELTDLLRTKLLMQQNGLKKLKKLGVTIEEEQQSPQPVVPPSINAAYS